MNFFLQKKYKYKIEGSLQEVKSEIKALLKPSWHDISMEKNIWGRFIDDNSFIAKPKFSIPIKILGFHPDYAILHGILSFEQGRTIIRLTVRPSLLILLLFYFLLIFFFAKLLNLKKPITIDSCFGPIALAFGLIFLYGIISFSMKRIRNRFESFVGIQIRK